MLIGLLHINKDIVFDVPKACSCHCDSEVSFLEESSIDNELILLFEALDVLADLVRENVAEVGALLVDEFLQIVEFLLCLFPDVSLQLSPDFLRDHYNFLYFL